MNAMTVRPVEGEDGRYFVTGHTLHCRNCSFTHTPPPGRQRPAHSEGSPCPRCADASKEGVLELREYLCDLALYNGLGRCGCRRWECHIQPQVNRMTSEERIQRRMSDDLRCHHLIAAMRLHALIKLDEAHRGEPATPAEEPS